MGDTTDEPSPMAQGEFDKEDLGLASIYVLAAASVVGIAAVELFGTTFSDTVLNVFNGVSLGTALSAGIFGYAYLTNDNDVQGLDDSYKYTVYATALLILSPALLPSVQDFVTQNDLFRVATVIVQSLGYAAVSYMA